VVFAKGREMDRISLQLSPMEVESRMQTDNNSPQKDALGSRAFGRSAQAGMFLAAATMPRSFERTLMPRNNLDQGIITGLCMALNYGVGVMVQDAIEGAAALILGDRGIKEEDDTPQRRITLAANASAIGLGLLLQSAFKQEPNEALPRAAARTSGYLVTEGAVAGLGVGVIQEWLASIDRRSKKDRKLRALPAALIGGGAVAVVSEFARRSRERRSFGDSEETGLASIDWNLAPARAALIGGGVTAAMLGLAIGEKVLAAGVSGALSFGLPGGQRLYRPVGHLATMGALAGAVAFAMTKAYHKVEAGTGKIEGAFDNPPESEYVSGGPGSCVPYETMGREGRRHVTTYLRESWIEAVMGEPARAHPVRIFVGLDSAPTDAERVQMAIDEMERTGAFDRELIVAVSPTGTGYVNYQAIEAIGYMTRGNYAAVTLQYSKRPSPMSLDRVWLGRKQFRMLIAAIHRRMYRMPPEKRPRLVVFGESLGSWTSQDAFLHGGTQGLEDAGVERALWIGTPNMSRWKHEVMGPPRPDVDAEAVGEFDNFGQVEALSPEAREKLRYVMITHGNDGVAYFGPDLLIQQPNWLSDAAKRPPRVPRYTKYTTPTTFVQTLIDMNNAMSVVPGEFEAKGHDYRGDLARFIRLVYDLPCSDEQLERIETALRRYEQLRGGLMELEKEEALPDTFAWADEGRLVRTPAESAED
jgi:uncharacterized membrane protein